MNSVINVKDIFFLLFLVFDFMYNFSKLHIKYLSQTSETKSDAFWIVFPHPSGVQALVSCESQVLS
jgi:hypothetical protein